MKNKELTLKEVHEQSVNARLKEAMNALKRGDYQAVMHLSESIKSHAHSVELITSK